MSAEQSNPTEPGTRLTSPGPGQDAPSSNGPVLATDKHGDLILEVSDGLPNGDVRKFLVSSKTLMLASPVFAAMFSPRFQEGAALRSSSSPSTVRLEEDDPVAMSWLLGALHFRTELLSEEAPSPKPLASLAIASNKYDCARALKPWVALWFRDIMDNIAETIKQSERNEIGWIVAAAFLFGTPRFTELTANLVAHLTATFNEEWERDEISGTFIPLAVIEDLAGKVKRLRADLEYEIQHGEDTLRRTNNLVYSTDQVRCATCGRSKAASPLKRCMHCGSTTDFAIYCTVEVRISDYFNALRAAQIWPLYKLTHVTAADIIESITKIPNSLCDHHCRAKGSCPLKITQNDLKEKALALLKRAQGINTEDRT